MCPEFMLYKGPMRKMDMLSTIQNNVMNSMSAMNLYKLNDENYRLRWMGKFCSIDGNFASTVHIGSLHLDVIAGCKSFY